MRSLALAATLLLPLLAGCMGGTARTQWAFEATQLDQGGRTGRDVVVAVLDTGINPSHAALAHLFDGDRTNGEVVAFRDYLNGQSGVDAAYDDAGHGTHVAGIIAARGSSFSDKLVYGGVDLLGGAPEVQLVVAKVCGASQCRAEAIPSAVQWAVEQHADVISLSLGGNRSRDIFTSLQRDDLTRSIQSAVARGVVVVASAGNNGASAQDVSTPADIPEVIAVGAIQEDGTVWSGSSRGSASSNQCQRLPVLGERGRCPPNQKPELVAPGVDILSAWTGDSYVRATGTSQATPFVTAAVALMLQDQPSIVDKAGVLRVKQALVESARPIPGQAQPHDGAAGYGLLQAQAAIEAYR
jgi:serine protease AprX